MKLIIDINRYLYKAIQSYNYLTEEEKAIANGTPIPDNATNGELFKQIFGTYATELWAKPESEFLEWLNGSYQKGGKR